MAGRFKTETDRLTGQFSSDITEIQYIEGKKKVIIRDIRRYSGTK